MTHSAARRFWNKRSSAPAGPEVVFRMAPVTLPGQGAARLVEVL